MSITGFSLTRLTLKGPGVDDAEVKFTAGLNVIFGPSDTGKTFIAQCIDFMLGASRKPKPIGEAKSYDRVFLGLRIAGVDNEIILERSLRGGDLLLYRFGEKVRELKEKHSPDDDETVSHFLLSASGLTGKKVRTNQDGKTRQLSFRDLARLVLVHEKVIIDDVSPIFSGQYTKKTVESSVFRLMLTGVDDSSVIAKEDQKIAKGRREGKSEIIEEMLKKARTEITHLEVNNETAELHGQLTLLENSLGEASEALAADQVSATQLEQERRKAWEQLRKSDTQLGILSELQTRFDLLWKQYISDLRRLEAISEVGHRLGQMTEERCPICGALANHHEVQHQNPHASLEEVTISCSAEAEKIRALLSDLDKTLKRNQEEIERLEVERQARRENLKKASSQLQENLQPRIQEALQNLQSRQAERDKVQRTIELRDRVRELEELLDATVKLPKGSRAKGSSTLVGADEAHEFCLDVEALLRMWNFPNLERVTFSEEDQDLIISGQRRSSYGKGVRAITHAAFNLGFHMYCKAGSKPHPGFVLIDSPLIVYQQPDVGEDDFNPDVKESFYRSLAKEFLKEQVIIVENETPPEDIRSSINWIEFSGTSEGRQGFIPNQAEYQDKRDTKILS